MKLAIISDTHAGARNSSDVFIEYQRRFYEEVFFPYLKQEGIENILHLGDYYEHRKYVNFKALKANREMFLDVLRKEKITMDIIPGNHDLFYRSTNELSSIDEIIGTSYSDVVHIHNNPTVHYYDGVGVALIPWINPNNHDEFVDWIKNCNASFCGGHFEFGGFEMNKGIESHGGMSTEIFNKFEQVWSGHYHTKSSKGNVTYLGSQMEFNWNDANDPKYFHVFDTETREITQVRNPLTLFEYHYYNDEKTDYLTFDYSKLANKFIKLIIVKKNDQYVFDRFLENLEDLGCHEIRISEPTADFDADEFDENSVNIDDTPTLLSGYVDALNIPDVDNIRLKEIMNSLYVEALNRGDA